MSAYGGKPFSNETNSTFRACHMSMRIREPTSRSKSAQAQEKTHFRQNQKQTQRSKGQMTSLTHLAFGEHPQANTRSPQGVHRSKMGPTASERDRPNPWVARPPTGPNQAHLSPANYLRVGGRSPIQQTTREAKGFTPR